MTKKPVFPLIFLVASLSFAAAIYPVGAEATPNFFSKDNLKRVVNGGSQDISVILESKTIVIRFQENNAEKESQIESQFGLKKIGTVPGRSDLTVFEFLKPSASREDAISRWNKILDSSDFASLVFAFPEGRYALSGAVKIQWKKFFSTDEIKRALAAFGLELVKFQGDSNTTLVRGTRKAGKNPLFWAIVFDPINDPRVFSVSPEFVRILPPIRSEASAEAGCQKGAGAGAPISSIICYRIKFYRAPNIEVGFDDLSINTKLLNSWLPENLSSDLRLFKGERVVKKAVSSLPSGEVLDIVEYKFQFLRSGEYVLPGLRYYYNITGNLEENKKRLEGLTDEIYVMVAPLALPNQQTVNEIPQAFLSQKAVKSSNSFGLKAPLWSGVLLLLLGILTLAFAINAKMREGKTDNSVPSSKKARDLWESKKSFIPSFDAVARINLLKELLGVYYFDNPYKFAGLHSGDWIEKIEEKIGTVLANKSAELVRSAEGGVNSGIDFEEMVLNIFGWKEEKK